MIDKEKIEETKLRLKILLKDSCDCPECRRNKNAYKILLQYIEELEQENKQYREFIFTTNGKDIENITATKYVQIRREGYIEGKIEEQNKSIKHINKLNKMIDEMAKELNKAYFDEETFYIWFEENIINEGTDCLSDMIERIKQYFKEKVEGRLNDNSTSNSN